MSKADPIAALEALDKEQEKLDEQREKIATSALEAFRARAKELSDEYRSILAQARKLCDSSGIKPPAWTGGQSASNGAAKGGGGKGGRRAKLSGPYEGMSQPEAILKIIGRRGSVNVSEIKEELEKHGAASGNGIGVALSKLRAEKKITSPERGVVGAK